MGLIPVFPGNPRQKHQFKVVVDGIDGAWFEKATIPEKESEIDEFNPAGSVRATKFAGRAKIGDCVLEKGVPANEKDLSAWNWLKTAVNTEAGELGLPADYRRDVEVQEVNHVGKPIQVFHMKEAFCSKVAYSDNEGGSSEHIIETLTLTVGDMELV